MERIITDKEKDMIINFGAFGYAPRKMSDILVWELSEVSNLYQDQKSEFYKYYREGKARADYVIDMKLFEMAQSGDMKAMAEFEKRTKSV